MWLVFGFLLLFEVKCDKIQELRIGGLFPTYAEEIAFRIAANRQNHKIAATPFRLVPHVLQIAPHDAYAIYRNACALLPLGMAAIFGPSSPHASSHLQAVLDKKELPHIETHWAHNLIRHNCMVNLHPHAAILSNAYVDLILAWRWTNILILYENEASLVRISPILQLTAKHNLNVAVKRLQHVNGTYWSFLTAIKQNGERHFVIDCSIDILSVVLTHAQQVGLMTEHYNYIITNLDLQTIDLLAFQFSGTNITGLRIVNPAASDVMEVVGEIAKVKNMFDGDERGPFQLSVKTALLIDGVELFVSAIVDFCSAHHFLIGTKALFCDRSDNWKYGHSIVNYMKGKTINGLTGKVKFDVEGFRSDFKLDIIELTVDGLSKIGTWHPKSKLNMTRVPILSAVTLEEGTLTNKTFVVITCLTTPYGMLKEETTQLTGNDRFEGFGIDLIHELSKMLGFNYTFTIQQDGYNGNYNATTGEWNGIIGEIIRGNADLAITDLTVTAERESVVDFSLQFMNLGICILYRKPKPVPPSLFMFASPFSNSVWLMLGVAYLLVSLAFFVMGRLSPSEWTNPFPCIDEPEFLINQFSIRNSFWFTVGSLMQQGTEIAPVGICTRTAAGVWWFFTLIMVSSYTANLAAFLTVETLVTSFNNVEELAAQTEIKYGAKRGGATANFFRDSGNNSVRAHIWNFMSANDKQMTESNDEGVEMVEKENYAYFMESTTIEYVVERHCSLSSVGPLLDDKGYAIAMKKNSPYRSELSTAILKLQETGRITALKEKWWREKRGAGNCGADDSGNEATPLNLQNVGGVFLVLFVGTFIGFIGAFIELNMRVYRETKKSQKSFRAEMKEELRFYVELKRNVKSVNYDPEQRKTDNKDSQIEKECESKSK